MSSDITKRRILSVNCDQRMVVYAQIHESIHIQYVCVACTKQSCKRAYSFDDDLQVELYSDENVPVRTCEVCNVRMLFQKRDIIFSFSFVLLTSMTFMC